jgi:hypothetical protein
MRSLLVTFVSLVLFAASSAAAEAKIAITVDKDNQSMTVAVDGVPRYNWPVSSGDPAHETPDGAFKAFRLEEDHYSKEFDEAPMPHSIFFTKRGHAIHGTDSVNRLGSPVSHGCVRLSRAHAATLFALVQADGVLNTTVTLTGSAQVALTRNPRGSSKAIARRNVAPSEPTVASVDAAGNPLELVPDVMTAPTRRVARQTRPQPDVYDYSSDEASAQGAPRGYRRGYDDQGNAYYYDRRGYAGGQYAPQEYARPVYRQRGLFTDYD